MKTPSLAIVFVLLATICFGFSTARAAPGQITPPKCLIRITGNDDSTTDVSVARLREFFPGVVDVLHGPAGTSLGSDYSLTVILGTDGSDPTITALWADHHEEDSDSYSVKTISSRPQVVVASGRSARGTMYAAYRLAELLETKADFSTLDVHQVPEVKRRYAALGAASLGGAYYRNMLYLKHLRELPRYGFNGVAILSYTSMSSPAGDDGPPFLIGADGITPIPLKLAEWRLLLREIKRYGLDVVLIVPPYFPGRYQPSDIVQHYSGEKPIPGYREELAEFFPRYLRTCLDQLPELDGFLLLNWEYPGNIGAQMFTIQSRNETYRYGPRDAQRSTEALEVYLQALENVTRERNKVAGFIVHNAGLRWNELHAMHDVLQRHERIIKIEPPYFTDNGWGQMPLFSFLPPDMDKDKVLSQGGPLGVYMTTTNGQYYGGGTLPTSYPDPFVAASGEAVKRKAELVMMMVGVWDGTAQGNLFDLNEILPLAANARMWSPFPGLDEIWTRWTTRRFGPIAGPILKPALKSTATIIRDGMTWGGVDVITHTALRAGSFHPPNVRFALLGKPGSPVLPPSDNGYSNPSNTVADQNKLRAIPLDVFRERQSAALAAAMAGAQAVEKARPNLSIEDYAYLRQVYADSQVVLRAIALIGEATHAANNAIENFDGVAHPDDTLAHALAALEAYGDEVRDFRGSNVERVEKSSSGLVIDPALGDTLKEIARDYRAYVALSDQERAERLARWRP